MMRQLTFKPVATVAAGLNVSVRTVRKWQQRYSEGGIDAFRIKAQDQNIALTSYISDLEKRIKTLERVHDEQPTLAVTKLDNPSKTLEQQHRS